MSENPDPSASSGQATGTRPMLRSLHFALRASVEMTRLGVWFGIDGPSTTVSEPQAEAGKEDRSNSKLQRDGRGGRREERFKCARDDQHRDRAGNELDTFATSKGDGVAAAQHAGEQNSRSDAQTG